MFDVVPEEEVITVIDVEVDVMVFTVVLGGIVKVVLVKIGGTGVEVDAELEISDDVKILEGELEGGSEQLE